MNVIFVKSEKQIDNIRKSCRLAAQTLQFIEPYLVPGAKTKDLDFLMETFIRDHKAIPAPLGYKTPNNISPYPKSTCISLNEVVCHGIPDDRSLKDGDIVGIDVTTILEGYYGDTAKTFGIGKISEDAEHLLQVTKKCLEIGIKQVKPGGNTGEIGYAISKYALLQGCSIVEQYCGHGVGFYFHELPQIQHICKKDDGVIMYAGMIFTIEPMLNLGSPDVIIEEDSWTVRTIDNMLSAQFEHTIAVTSEGYEILTLA